MTRPATSGTRPSGTRPSGGTAGGGTAGGGTAGGGGTGGTTTGQGALARATLTGMTGGALSFPFNPLKVSISKKATTEGGRGMITNSFEDAVKAIGNLTIKLSDVNFVGPGVKAACDQLIAWVTPVPQPGTGAGGLGRGSTGSRAGSGMTGGGMTGGGLTGGSSAGRMGRAGGSTSSTSTTMTPSVTSFRGAGTVYKLPVLMFMWGGGGGASGLSYRVVLENVDISYERFTAQGAPLWAKVNLTLKEYAEELPPTNPTSGGEPGRTKHLVIAGDSVVRIANDSYGTPSAWRDVAEANRLDDPLRIRPGRILDLPGVTELGLEDPE